MRLLPMQANHDLKRHEKWGDRSKGRSRQGFLYGFPWDSSISQYETQRHEKIKYNITTYNHLN